MKKNDLDSNTLENIFLRQILFSCKTFGQAKERGPLGPARHLVEEVKELIESLENFKQDTKSTMAVFDEYADCFILILDSYWRFCDASDIVSYHNTDELMRYFYHTIAAKQEINEKRKWNNQISKDNPTDQPIFHKKDSLLTCPMCKNKVDILHRDRPQPLRAIFVCKKCLENLLSIKLK